MLLDAGNRVTSPATFGWNESEIVFTKQQGYSGLEIRFSFVKLAAKSKEHSSTNGMSTTKKIVWGLGIAGGALLAAWLLTGDRKKKTKEILGKGARTLRKTLTKENGRENDGSEVHYV